MAMIQLRDRKAHFLICFCRKIWHALCFVAVTVYIVLSAHIEKLTVFLAVLIFTCSWIELDVAHVSNCFLFVKTYMRRIHAVHPILIQSTFQNPMMIKKKCRLRHEAPWVDDNGRTLLYYLSACKLSQKCMFNVC